MIPSAPRPTFAHLVQGPRIGAAVVALVTIACAFGPGANEADGRGSPCPAGMALVEGGSAQPGLHLDGRSATQPGQHLTDKVCIDRYEASLVEVTPEGERAFSPYETVKGRKVRAVSRSGVVPQAYISRNEAEVACATSHKRLCREEEWTLACQGRKPTTFPYGDERKSGYCNDEVPASPLATYYGGGETYTFEPMNDPRLNQLPGTVSRTGKHEHCKSSYGVFDMVGNVHEWVQDPSGTFLGGYYLDTHLNGDGCHYKTVAHGADYHDYSTGFRCCADPPSSSR